MNCISDLIPENAILLGNCIQMMATFPADSIDLAFADPPYNLSGKSMQWEGKEMGGNWYKINEHWDTLSKKDYFEFTHHWLNQVVRVIRPAGAVYICCTLHNISVLMSILDDLNMRCNNIITWYKPNAMPSMTRRNFTHSTEFVLYYVKGSGWTFNYQALKEINPERRKDGESRQMRDLWAIPVCQGKERLHGPDNRALHPTQKPEALVERAIIASSQAGDLVLDPFIGSGTTAVVAERHGRRWIGIERDADYRNAALERIAQVQKMRSRKG